MAGTWMPAWGRAFDRTHPSFEEHDIRTVRVSERAIFQQPQAVVDQVRGVLLSANK